MGVPIAEADLCLIPEIPIVTEGPTSIFAHLKRVLQRKGHAVVVVAEGAGEELLTADKLKRGEPIEVDAGGNRKLPPIGTWLKKAISQYFESEGIKTAIKYLDPSCT
ncbi:hypothetical protein EON66_08985 [archaeon]|nr:MAG: hypothetical protein EON66_08985 [archaeon]